MKRKWVAFAAACCMLSSGMLQASALTFTEAEQILSTGGPASGSDDLVYQPIRPAEGDAVNTYSYENPVAFAVVCQDADVIESGIFAVMVEGRIDPYWVELKSMTEYKERYTTAEYGVVDPEVVLPEAWVGMEDSVCVLTTSITLPAYQAILNDERFAGVGLLTDHYEQTAIYAEAVYGTWLHLEAEEGYAFDQAALEAEGIIFADELTEDTKTVSCMYRDALPLAEAIALCEALEAREDIAFAWPEGFITANTPLSAITHISVTPLTLLTGDPNGDDMITADDARVALQAYVNQTVMQTDSGLTALQLSAVDVNADNALTAEDANWILHYYVHNTVLGVETDWSQILPE